MKAATRYAVTLLAALSLASAAPDLALGQIRAGQKLPPISGRSLTGEPVDLADYHKDSIMVVAFWSIYCKPCVAEISSLLRLQELYPGKLRVVGVNIDGELPPTRVATFIQRYEEFEKKHVDYPIVFDEHNKISKQLGVGYLPTVLAVDTSGTIINVFVGFEEKDEAEIFAGIEKMLPITKPAAAGLEDEIGTYDVELQVPACAFYDETGWRESFYGGKDLDKEIDQMAEVARSLAMKGALRQALAKLGVVLYESKPETSCVQPYGIMLQENPWNRRDCFTNLLNSLQFRKYSQVLETREKWLGNAYYVKQRISVNLTRLKDELEDKRFSLTPLNISFVVVNMDGVQRMVFERELLSQSMYIGQAGFPAFSIYTTQENFIAELERMEHGGSRVFVSEAGSGVIEAELWR